MGPHDEPLRRTRGGGRRKQRRLVLNILGFAALFLLCMVLGVVAADRYLGGTSVSPHAARPTGSTAATVSELPSQAPAAAPSSQSPVQVMEVPSVGTEERESRLREFVSQHEGRRPRSSARRRERPPSPPKEEPRAEEPVPAPTEELAPEPTIERPGPVYSVQAGAFENEDNARRVADELAGAGYGAAISTRKSKGRTLYKVVVGSFDREDDAKAMEGDLQGKGFDAQVNQD